MNIRSKRLETFFDHQPLWPYISNAHYHTPEQFANAGFYSVSTKRVVDKVQCYLCDITLADWKQGQSPLERHALTSAHCPLVILNFPRGQGFDRDTAVLPEPETMLKARLMTFTENTIWPPSKPDSNTKRNTRSSSRQNAFPSAEKLAQAGFIFIPTLECLDRVQCPDCRYHLGDLSNNLDPWLLHQQSSPNCLFVTRCRSNKQLKSGNTSKKRGPLSEDITLPLSSVSTPSFKKRRRSATTTFTKTTTTSESSTDNNCHGGGGGGVDIDKADDSMNRSIVDDSIWDIGNIELDYRPLPCLVTKTQKQLPSTKSPLCTYAKKVRKASRTTRSHIMPVNQPVKTSTNTTTPSPPNQRTETAAQLLTRLQKLPITRITSKDKGKGKAIEDTSTKAAAPKTVKKLGRDSLRLSTKKKPSTGVSPSCSSSSTPHTVDFMEQCNSPQAITTYSTIISSSFSDNNSSNTMDVTTFSSCNRGQGSSSL